MVTAVKFILGLWFSTAQCVKSQVTWTMLDKNVVMGKDVTLFCNGSNCHKNCTRRWYGGPEKVVLALNEVSSFPSKYTSRMTDNGFYLYIRHLDERDLNVSYSCTVGFETFKQMLYVEAEDFADNSLTIMGSVDYGTTAFIPTKLKLIDGIKINKTAFIIGAIVTVTVIVLITIVVFVKRRRRGQKNKQNGESSVRKSDIEEHTDLLSDKTVQEEQENKTRQNGHVNSKPKSAEHEILLSNTTEHTTEEIENGGPPQSVNDAPSNEDQNTVQKSGYTDETTGNTSVKTIDDSECPSEHTTNTTEHTDLKHSQGAEDLVRCFHCAGAVHDWHENDDPWVAHARWFPMCRFLQKKKGQEFINMVLETHTHNRPTEDQTGTSSESNSTEHITTNNKGPKYPELDLKSNRLRTLDNWPANKLIKPDVVADAGFFYKVKDGVHCFWCGEGLADWKIDDDPWAEHKRWYPECDFVKSTEFTNTHANYLRPEDINHEQKQKFELTSATSKTASTDETTKRTPLFPQYEQEKSRLATFFDWSPLNVQKPKNLARAGFFVTDNSAVNCTQNKDVLDG